MDIIYGESLEELHKLYPELNDEELRDAKERIDEYIKIALRIFERLEEKME